MDQVQDAGNQSQNIEATNCIDLTVAQQAAEKLDYVAAREELERILSVAPSHIGAELLMADILFAQESYEEALRRLEAYQRAYLSPLLKRIGLCRYNLGDVIGARNAFQQSLLHFPNDVDALVSLGDLLLGVEEFQEAHGYFSRALELSPLEVEAAVGLVMAASHLNNPAASQRSRRLLADLDPAHPLLQNPPLPTFDEARRDDAICSVFRQGEDYFGPVILNPSTLAAAACSPAMWQALLSFHEQLVTDPYVDYVNAYYQAGVRRFGEHWRYLDISNVLFAASKLIQPKRYLEIGVRRGRSTCIVARACPTVDIVAFDMWIPNYAGMANPGPSFVASELQKHGHMGEIAFIDGNSHETVPAYFNLHPNCTFDLITVDGDHSEEGAFDDLCNVIPYLAPGGVLVFDDISHPLHPYLLDVWRKAMQRFPHLAAFEFTETGYGVAFAIAMR